MPQSLMPQSPMLPANISGRPTRLLATLALLLLALGPAPQQAWAEVSELRMTPIVRAVQNASPSVVNIQGQKTVADATAGAADGTRQVNGMGTGVVIDPRGYILTNHHVVDGVRQINVTLSDRRVYTAHIVAHDKRTDLAVIRVQTGRSLPTIDIGSSSDLMTGEPVIAVGNAFGYEHTVTRGIVSALHRDVQVSDTQSYEDLIQTDASINPGNSGGPLLSIEGRMVGVNVAVRAGAQGIGFAIPVDKAMDIAAELMSVRRLENKNHGLVIAKSTESPGKLLVRRVSTGSPAQASGLKPGDVIKRIGGREANRPLDLELALLGQRSGQSVDLEVERDNEELNLQLAMSGRGRSRSQVASVTPTKSTGNSTKNEQRTWEVLGLDLEQEPRSTFVSGRSRYRGGMRVMKVRPGSPAAQKGIRSGDILVGMHEWETASEKDIRYIVTRPNLSSMGSLKFYILRGDETLFGHLNVAGRTRTASRR